jgi:starvation-inducible DNA-binding protein
MKRYVLLLCEHDARAKLPTERTSTNMYPTGIDLSETKRVQLIELSNACLADAVDLQLHCKHAHWNVKGPNFIALHHLFDQVNESVEDYIDLIAERAVQLGGIANSTAHVVTTWAHMPENYTQNASERDYVHSLSEALASFGKIAREAIGKSNELGDVVSADVFTEISRGVEKWLWMVEAHLQSQP